jgi:transposase InsO family protein
LPKDEGDRHIATVPSNILDRQFAAERPNEKWIADFTYIWTAEGWLYVAAVIDLFSRRVVGWSMSAGMTAQLVADALLMAIWRRGKNDGQPVVISQDARQRGAAANRMRAVERAADLAPTIAQIRAAGAETLTAIAAGLNDAGIQTPRGQGKWSPAQVARTLEAMKGVAEAGE